MCGGGTALGALAGALLAPATFGASLGLGALTGSGLGAIAGGMAGKTLVDDPAMMKKGLDAQNKANDSAIAAAKQQADQADQAMNRANGKAPDLAALMGQNVLNAKGGQSGTMLTGPQGVDPNSLLLGKKTLLGG